MNWLRDVAGGSSWKTTVLGIAIIAAVAGLYGIKLWRGEDIDIEAVIIAIMGILGGTGLYAARDNDKRSEQVNAGRK